MTDVYEFLAKLPTLDKKTIRKRNIEKAKRYKCLLRLLADCDRTSSVSIDIKEYQSKTPDIKAIFEFIYEFGLLAEIYEHPLGFYRIQYMQKGKQYYLHLDNNDFEWEAHEYEK